MMQDWSMTLDKVIDYAARAHAETPVVTRDQDGIVSRSNYGSIRNLARRFSAALARDGIGLGDRVGTLQWNTANHMACWFGSMGIGAVLHTLNPRLHPDQLAWIATHAGDRLLVIEEQFIHLVASIIDRMPSVEKVIVVTSNDAVAPIGDRLTLTLDAFLADDGESAVWGDFEEQTASSLCYTSGTTGDPKGVLYSHRSNFIHAWSANQPNGFGLRADDVVMPIVPMFHANAWGLTFIAPMTGAALVLPGSKLDGASLHELMESEGVTFAASVPTVWQELLRHLKATGGKLTSLRKLMVGGSAVPADIVRAFDAMGVEVSHGWGMTEMSPLGSITMPLPDERQLTHEERIARICRQGRALFPAEAEIFDAKGQPCHHDDVSPGFLKVRGPSVVETYYGATRPALDEAGYFDTGDIAVIDPAGFIRLVDRAKDVVKSGGEWISSIELENHAMGHPGVRRAAVLAMPDPKWGERPLLLIEPATDEPPSAEEIREHLAALVPKWWLPEKITYCTIPLGATGKIDKVALRKHLADGLQDRKAPQA